MDRITEMSCFVKTVESGSFAAAARMLSMLPQVVGKHVASLEERLGTQLLVRTTRSNSLTEAGQLFYQRCVVILQQAEDAETLVAQRGSAPKGQLMISAPYTFGSYRLMPFLARFLEQNENVRVKLILSDRHVDVVAEGYDAAIRIGDLEDTSIVARRLRSFRLVACASPSYIKQRGLPNVPSDLLEHECLIYNYWYKPPLSEWTFQLNGIEESVVVPGRMQVNDGRSVIEAAIAGYGIVLQDPEILLPKSTRAALFGSYPTTPGPFEMCTWCIRQCVVSHRSYACLSKQSTVNSAELEKTSTAR